MAPKKGLVVEEGEGEEEEEKKILMKKQLQPKDEEEERRTCRSSRLGTEEQVKRGEKKWKVMFKV